MDDILISVIWIIAASLLGFSISAIFSNMFKLSRRVFLLPYVLITSVFLFAFININKIDLNTLFYHNWVWGIISGIIISLFLVRNVFSQPNSRKNTGGSFAFDLLWTGLTYGLIDALFLNVMPVLAVFNAASTGLQSVWGDKIIPTILALLASLLVTLAYHLGYSEFRNKSVILVLLGNMLITLAFLVSANPLGAIISHTVMHIAAVIRGAETTIQLPPHR